MSSQSPHAQNSLFVTDLHRLLCLILKPCKAIPLSIYLLVEISLFSVLLPSFVRHKSGAHTYPNENLLLTINSWAIRIHHSFVLDLHIIPVCSNKFQYTDTRSVNQKNPGNSLFITELHVECLDVNEIRQDAPELCREKWHENWKRLFCSFYKTNPSDMREKIRFPILLF